MKTKSKLVKKQLTMITLVVALALAVYLNWRFANKDNSDLLATEVVTSGEQSESTDKYYGEALFVSADEAQSAEDYFAETRLSRSQSRDEALDTLQKALNQTNLTQAEKDQITASLASVAGSITKENSIENLVKARGFADCVAFISGDKVKVVVQSGPDGLSVSEASQIKEIVVDECGVAVQNITIVEIK